MAIAVGAAAAALVAATIMLASDGNESPQVRARPGFFGVNAPLLRAYATPDRPGTLERQARAMGELGVSWARIVFDQAVEQRDPAQPDWAIPDAVVSALARHAVRADALFMGAARWEQAPEVSGSCGSRGEPGDVRAWASFAAAAASRYGSEGSFWAEHPELPRQAIRTYEIWNEPNVRLFWCPLPNPVRYAELFAAASAAIVAADPKAQVVVGGLVTDFGPTLPGDLGPGRFLAAMLAARPEVAGRIDAVAIHPYGTTPSDVLEKIAKARAALRGVGLADTPLLVNEVGWHTQGPPGPLLVSESQRAQRVAELVGVAGNTDCGLTGLGMHAWITAERDPLNPSDWYGIADPVSGALHETASAYRAAIAGDRSADTRALASAAETLCG